MPFALTMALAVMAVVITPGWSHAAARAQTRPPAQSRPTPPSTAALEQAVFQQVNAYRARQRLPALRWDERLAQQARQHSQTMLNSGLGHAGFAQRLAATGLPWSAAAENVAYNQQHLESLSRNQEGEIEMYSWSGNSSLTAFHLKFIRSC